MESLPLWRVIMTDGPHPQRDLRSMLADWVYPPDRPVQVEVHAPPGALNALAGRPTRRRFEAYLRDLGAHPDTRIRFTPKLTAPEATP